MKSKLLALCIIAMFLAGAMALASCKNDGGDGRKCHSWTACDHDNNDTCGKSGCYNESKGNGCSC